MNNLFMIVGDKLIKYNGQKPEAVTIDPKIRVKGKNSFDRSNLNRVNCPSGLQIIEGNAFLRCGYLTNADLSGTKLISIGAHAFAYSAIQSILLPPTLEKIDDGAFEHCSQLKSIDLSYTKVTSIWVGAFCNAGLKEVTLPYNLNRISSNAFKSCPITKVNVRNGTIYHSYIPKRELTDEMWKKIKAMFDEDRGKGIRHDHPDVERAIISSAAAAPHARTDSVSPELTALRNSIRRLENEMDLRAA